MKARMTVILFYAFSFALLILFSRTDLQISTAFNQPHLWLWRFFEAFGEWPLFALTALASFYLLMTETRNVRSRKLFWICCWGLSAIASSAMAGSLPLYFLTRDFVGDFAPWIVIGIPIAMVLCFWGVKRLIQRFNDQRTRFYMRQFALTCVYFFWSAHLLVNVLKLSWGRIRFRDLVDPVADFTVWYLPQGYSGNYSFPSGHAMNATAAFLTVLLPQVFPSLRVKPWAFYSLSALWMVFVSLSRVGIGAHYPSDVTVGAMLGVSLFLLLKHRFDRICTEQFEGSTSLQETKK